jgi:integrase
MLAGTGGLRWGEITALAAEDLRFGDRPTVTVLKAYVEVGGSLSLGPTKGGDNRVVPLPRLIADRLANVVADRAPGERLFGGRPGSALRNNTWTRRHYGPAITAVAATDPTFPRPTFHDLRHTAVSLAISAGVNKRTKLPIGGPAIPSGSQKVWLFCTTCAPPWAPAPMLWLRNLGGVRHPPDQRPARRKCGEDPGEPGSAL